MLQFIRSAFLRQFAVGFALGAVAIVAMQPTDAAAAAPATHVVR